jgi:hypothetical protein
MNGNYDGGDGPYGTVQYLALVELNREWNKMTREAKARNGAHYEAQAWLWRHKLWFFASGALMLALLIISTNGV